MAQATHKVVEVIFDPTTKKTTEKVHKGRVTKRQGDILAFALNRKIDEAPLAAEEGKPTPVIRSYLVKAL